MAAAMRSLSLVLALLIVALAVVFGLSTRFAAPATTAPAVSATATAPAAAPGLPQGHVYAGVTWEPEDVNPFTSHDTVARRFVLGFTHEGLLDIDPATGALRGALAEAWQLAADGMSCTFTLRADARFSDGAPVTMADVLFGWELARAGHLPFGFVGTAFAQVAAAEPLGERELHLRFAARHYAALRAVGECWFVAQRAFFVDRVAALSRRLGREPPPIGAPEFAALFGQIDRECGPGTGPFALPSGGDGPLGWNRRQDLTLVRNPHHWRRLREPGTWNLEGVRLLFREGPAVFNALVQGEIDWLGGWMAPAVLASRPELAERYRLLVYDYENLGVLAILWNCSKPAFADVRVRRALAMLLDREAIVRKFAAAVAPAFAFAKPTSPGYPEPVPLGCDPAAARRLLREAGFDAALGTPLRLSLLATPDGGPMDLAVDLLVDAGKAAGVEITVDALAFPAWVAKKKQDDWDGLVVNREFRPWGDPFDFVHSAGVDNDGHWANAAADDLAAAARQELDAGRRALLWRELHELVYQEQPALFLVHPRACLLCNRFLMGAEPGPRGLWPERWWVAPEHQRK
jgi:ABC-type transport system substrate-binding protein